MTRHGFKAIFADARRMAALTALFLSAGCATYELSTLKTESDRLQVAMATCQVADQAGTAPCLTNTDMPMLDLARRAQHGAPIDADPLTRISYLSTAALNGWSSQTEDGAQIADDAAAEGVEICASLGPKVGYRLDCNLMAFEPGFARHTRAMIFIDKIDHSARPLDPATVAELHEQSATYVANSWDFIESKRAELDAGRMLNADMALYLDSQRLALFCAALKFGTLEDRIDGPGTDALLAEIDSKMAKPHKLRQQDCSPSIFGLSADN